MSLVTFAEDARVGLAGPEGDSVRATLEERRTELLEALEWLAAHDRPDEASRLAGAMVPFWMASKRMDEGDASFERVQHDETVAGLTERLGVEGFEEARARGLATAPDQAGQL